MLNELLKPRNIKDCPSFKQENSKELADILLEAEYRAFAFAGFYDIALNNVTISNKTFVNCNFQRCNLQNVTFQGCVFLRSHFVFSDCRGMVLIDCSTGDVDLDSSWGFVLGPEGYQAIMNPQTGDWYINKNGHYEIAGGTDGLRLKARYPNGEVNRNYEHLEFIADYLDRKILRNEDHYKRLIAAQNRGK